MILLVSCPLVGSSSLWAKDNDFQFWTELKYNHKLKDSKFSLHWAMENRFQNDASDYFLFNTTLGFYYQIIKYIKMGMFYRVEKKEDSDWENRVMPQIEFSANLGPVKLSDRNRFEFRFFPDDFRFRYRNEAKVAHKIKTEPVSFTPYVSDEVFFETEKGGFNENRLKIGNAFGFLKDRLDFDLYYLLQRKDSNGIWSTNHILGTSLSVNY